MAVEKKIHRVTLQNVAKSCKLSVPTVSQILNNRASNFSSEETRRLVRETAEKLGYRPNLGYKIMRGISTKTVAIIIGHANAKDSEYIRQLAFLLLEQLSHNGYSVYIETMPDDWTKRYDAMINLIQRGTEHFISIGKPCEWEDLPVLEKQMGITMMTFCTDYRNSVNVNVENGVIHLLEHFLKRKCKKIRTVITNDKDRMQAIRKVLHPTEEQLESMIVPLPPEAITPKADMLKENMEYGWLKTKELFEKEPDTDAVLYLSDYFAIGGAKYLLETGRRIGKDVLLAGYNNTLPVQAYAHPISSVSHNLRQVADCIMANFTKKDSGIFNIEPIMHIRD